MPPPPPILNPVSSRFLALFRDKQFFLMCILLSVSLGAGFVAGSGISIPTAIVLALMWALYADAKKGIVRSSNMRVVSGAILAEFIVNIVAAVALVLFAILVAVVTAVFISNEAVGSEVIAGIIQAFEEANFHFTIGNYSIPFDSITSVAGIFWICVAVLLFLALEMIVIHVVGYRKMHKLAKASYMGVESGKFEFSGLGGVKIWLVLFIIYSIGSALLLFATLEIIGAAAYATNAAALIVAKKLIDRYFAEN